MHDRNALGPLLGRCGHLARERMDARLTPYGVTPAQIHVILYLRRNGGSAPQCDVTNHLKVKPSTAAGILDRMAEKGLVERSSSEEDARRKLITLTEKGMEQREVFRDVFRDTEELMTAGFTAEERETLLALLRRVAANLEEDRSL